MRLPKFNWEDFDDLYVICYMWKWGHVPHCGNMHHTRDWANSAKNMASHLILSKIFRTCPCSEDMAMTWLAHFQWRSWPCEFEKGIQTTMMITTNYTCYQCIAHKVNKWTDLQYPLRILAAYQPISIDCKQEKTMGSISLLKAPLICLVLFISMNSMPPHPICLQTNIIWWQSAWNAVSYISVWDLRG